VEVNFHSRRFADGDGNRLSISISVSCSKHNKYCSGGLISPCATRDSSSGTAHAFTRASSLLMAARWTLLLARNCKPGFPAFQPKWWNSDVVVDKDSNFLHTGRPVNTDEYSQMEYNFSMFWGMAIQMYESTLVSNNSRFDQFMDGNRGALTAQEQRGLDRFQGKGHCTSCHNGGEITDATVSNVLAHGGVVEVLPGGRWHDIGFHNIGVRPVTDDLGIAASDPSGLASLSAAQMASMGQLSGTAVPPGAPVSVRGAVKTPSLRNIELTAPFFLNGGQASLEQVVDFYSRGGDFPSADVDPSLERASFSADDKAAVVAFLKSLTDERVHAQSAPFDHPSLTIPNGMVMIDGALMEQTVTIPATGASGGAPLQKFCEGLAGGGCN